RFGFDDKYLSNPQDDRARMCRRETIIAARKSRAKYFVNLRVVEIMGTSACHFAFLNHVGA
ncbi:MAG: hypothetical protein KIT16_20620, partial [Rhodospirillaceae bacterium]|nr:hypothetical protein [Rhodospirillaceae bacterium]